MQQPIRLVAVAVVVAVIVAAWFWTRPGAGDSSQASPDPALALMGGCGDQPTPPPLPGTLSPATPDLPGVIQALDAALTEEHKTWLRCFVLDDELIGETQHGFARWIRTKLRLRGTAPLRESLQATSPDEASSIIVIAYAHHLRGDALTVAQARARRTEALAVIGVSR